MTDPNTNGTGNPGPYCTGRIQNEEVFEILRQQHEFALCEDGLDQSLAYDNAESLIAGVIGEKSFRTMYQCPAEAVVVFLGTKFWETKGVSGKTLLGYGITAGYSPGERPYVFRDHAWNQRLRLRFLALLNRDGRVPGISLDEISIRTSAISRLCRDHQDVVARVLERIGRLDLASSQGSTGSISVGTRSIPVEIWPVEEGRDWTEYEYRLIVATYMEQLQRQMRNEAPDLREAYEFLTVRMPNRSQGAIRMALQNLSGFVLEEGYDAVEGLSPLSNYNHTFVPRLANQWLSENAAQQQAAEESLGLPTERGSTPPDILQIEQNPPTQTEGSQNGRRAGSVGASLGHRSQEENSVLGRRGEELVIEFERARLIEARRPDLANRIVHVAASNDAAGYDILSFEVDGSQRYVEVKTTNGGIRTAFFLSENERLFSNQNSQCYFLYRVYSFSSSPRLYKIRGSVDANFNLVPTEYRVTR